MCLNPIFLDKIGGQVPCGKCVECAQQKANEWAFRVLLEIGTFKEKKCSCFLTLTFDDENLGENNLEKSELQKFIKRLRKKHENDVDFKIKYIGCGEYGKKRGRKHYHVVLIGYDFEDTLYKFENHVHSTELDELWKFGFADVDKVEFNSIKYVCKYLQKFQWQGDKIDLYGKKTVFKKPPDEYKKDVFGKIIDKNCGKYFVEKFGKNPPFFLCSKGIGYENWEKDFDFVSGKIYIDGRYIKIPRYFLDRFERDNYVDLSEFREYRKKISCQNIKTYDEIKKHKEFVKVKLLTKGR